jgi:MFS family permease
VDNPDPQRTRVIRVTDIGVEPRGGTRFAAAAIEPQRDPTWLPCTAKARDARIFGEGGRVNGFDCSDAAAAAPGPMTVSRPFGARFVTPMLVGAALNPINSSVIATAMVAIAAAMHVPVGQTSILVSSLYLTCAIAQPTAGKLSEEFGPRRIFLAGIAVVLVGGAVGGIAGGLSMLVCARVLIGLGTSTGYPSAMLLIRRRSADVGLQSPPSSVLGALAVAGAATLAVGPTIGGLLVEWFGWRAAFLINIPVACAAGAMVLLWIPRDPAVIPRRSLRVAIARLDLPGVVCFTGVLTSALVLLVGLPHLRWVALGVAIAFAVLLVWRELRTAHPFIDVRLLVRRPALTRTYVRSALTVLGTYVVLYGLTQWIMVDHGQSAFMAGLLLLPMGALSAMTAHAVSGRQSPRLSLIGGAVLLVAGSASILLLSSATPILGIIGVTAIFGVTNGASSVGNQLALYTQAPAETIGTASGLLRTFSYVGSIASAVITGAAFSQTVDTAGLHRVGLILVAIGAVVLLMTICDRRLGSTQVDRDPIAG